MSHFLIRASSLLIAGFTALTIIAGVLGSAHPSNPALAGFTEGCETRPQPCWYGIVPGVTTIDEANATLANMGYVRGPFFFYSLPMNLVGAVEQMPKSIYLRYSVAVPHAVIYSIALSDWDTTLGDLISVLGSPNGLGGGFSIRNPFLAYASPYGLLLVELNSMPARFSPAKVKVNYVLLTQYQQLADSLVGWHGFVPKWQYCSLEPKFLFCP